jgi:hypothetical protein
VQKKPKRMKNKLGEKTKPKEKKIKSKNNFEKKS